VADSPKVSVVLELLDRLTGPINGIEGRMRSFSDTIAGIGKAIAATFGAIAIGKFAIDSVQAFLDSEESIDRLQTALGHLGIAYDKVGPHLDDVFKKIQETTRFTDEDAREALTNLITMTGNYSQSVKDLGLVADVAQFKHTTMAAAAETVGKVHQGQLKVLKEFGINALGAADGIDKLRSVTQDYAENAGRTIGGRLSEIKNQWDEVKEAVGKALVGQGSMNEAAKDFATTLARLATWVDNHSEVITAIANLATGTARAAGNLIGMAIEGWQRIGERLGLIQVEGTKVITREETERSRAVKAEAEARGKDQAKATKQQVDDELAARKKAHENLHDLEKLALRTSLELVSAQQKEYEALTATFQEKMQGMNAADRAKSEALLKDAHANLLLKWSGVYNEIIPVVHQGQIAIQGSFMDTKAPIKDLSEEIDRHIKKIDADTEAKERLRTKVMDLGQAFKDQARRLGELAQNLAPVFGDELNQKILDIVTSISDIGDALTQIGTGDVLGGATKGIGALVALGKTIFGGSGELQRQFEKNTRRLEELRTTMGDLIDAQSPGRAVGAIAGLEPFQDKGFMDSAMKGRGFVSSGDLAKFLTSHGSSLAEFTQLASDFGIDLKPDKNGKYNLAAVLAVISAARTADTGFKETFKGQKEAIKTGVDLGAIADETTAAVGLVTDSKYGSPAIRKALEGLNLGTPTGATEAIGRLRQLFTDTAAGKLTPADFGGMSEREFLDSLGWIINLLAPVAAGGPVISGPSTGGTGGTVSASSGSSSAGNGGGGVAETGSPTAAGPSVDFSVGSSAGTDWASMFNVWAAIGADTTKMVATLTEIDMLLTRASAAGPITIEQTYNLTGTGLSADDVKQATDDANKRLIDELLAARYQDAKILTGSAVRL
jgi:hypothetical protein